MTDEPIKALILEDNPDDLLVLEKLIKGLRRRNIILTSVKKLSDAANCLKNDHFDLIISDLTLPDSRGLETFRSLRAQAPKAPVILLTGSDDESMAVQAVREGAQDYLVKGEISSGLLLRAIIYAIERNRLKEEREKLIIELTDALSKVKVLSGLLPICASCKKIRNDGGYWEQVEMYLREHADIEFTHGFCPDCMKKLYPEFIPVEKGK